MSFTFPRITLNSKKSCDMSVTQQQFTGMDVMDTTHHLATPTETASKQKIQYLSLGFNSYFHPLPALHIFVEPRHHSCARHNTKLSVGATGMSIASLWLLLLAAKYTSSIIHRYLCYCSINPTTITMRQFQRCKVYSTHIHLRIF